MVRLVAGKDLMHPYHMEETRLPTAGRGRAQAVGLGGARGGAVGAPGGAVGGGGGALVEVTVMEMAAVAEVTVV